MIEGTNRVEIEDVEVLDYRNMVMRCRVWRSNCVGPSLALLLGTNIKYRGDRGRLVLPHDLAVDLGLVG